MTSMLLIRTIDEVTPEVMTSVLRASAGLGADQEVTSVDAVSFGDKSGLLSLLYRVSLTYSDGADGPETAVVKFPTDDPGQRGIADALGFFNRECVFYKEIAPTAPFRSPAVYGMAQADDSTDFVIIMEDLGHMDPIDQVAGASLADSEKALTALANLHAHYWEHDDLDELNGTFLPMDNPIYHAALPDVFGGGWAGAKVHVSDLDPAIVEFGDNWTDHLPNLLAALDTPRTLLHGDYRSENILIDADGGQAVIDFQITSVGNCAFDIAYFLSSSITTELRREQGDHLIRLYHDTLTAGEVEYEFAQFKNDLRVAIAFCMIYGVASFVGWDSFNDRQKELMMAIALRTYASILDHDAIASLSSL